MRNGEYLLKEDKRARALESTKAPTMAQNFMNFGPQTL